MDAYHYSAAILPQRVFLANEWLLFGFSHHLVHQPSWFVRPNVNKIKRPLAPLGLEDAIVHSELYLGRWETPLFPYDLHRPHFVSP